MKTAKGIIMAASILTIFLIVPAFGGSAAFKDNIYDPGKLKPIDSKLKVKVGDLAPDFTLPLRWRSRNQTEPVQGEEKCDDILCSGRLDAGLLRSVAGIQHCQRNV